MNIEVRKAVEDLLKTLPLFEGRVFPLSGVKRDVEKAFAEISTGRTIFNSMNYGYEKKVPVLIQVIFPAVSDRIQDEADGIVEDVLALFKNVNLNGLVDDIAIKSTDTAVSNNASIAIGYCEIEMEVTYEEY